MIYVSDRRQSRFKKRASRILRLLFFLPNYDCCPRPTYASQTRPQVLKIHPTKRSNQSLDHSEDFCCKSQPYKSTYLWLDDQEPEVAPMLHQDLVEHPRFHLPHRYCFQPMAVPLPQKPIVIAEDKRKFCTSSTAKILIIINNIFFYSTFL